MIKEKLGQIERRGKPTKYAEYVDEWRGSKRKDYDYYICDYCGERIKPIEPKHQRTGGTTKLSYVLTKRSTVEVALCNKCINPTLKELGG